MPILCNIAASNTSVLSYMQSLKLHFLPNNYCTNEDDSLQILLTKIHYLLTDEHLYTSIKLVIKIQVTPETFSATDANFIPSQIQE